MPKETMTKRFYASKSAIRAPFILKTLKEAVDEAKDLIEKNNLEEYYVVEIVRIVRVSRPPIEVIETR